MGPNGTSLLEKLGFQRAHVMAKNDLLELVKRSQARRSAMRAVGRVIRAAKGTRPAKIKTLEDIGLAPAICAKLRAGGLPDLVIIQAMQSKGLI